MSERAGVLAERVIACCIREVVHVRLTPEGSGAHSPFTASAPFKLSHASPNAHRFELTAKYKSDDAGGAVIRTASGQPPIAGIVVARGEKSQSAYIERLDDPKLVGWIRDIAALMHAEQPLPKASSPVAHPPPSASSPTNDPTRGVFDGDVARGRRRAGSE